MLTIKVLGSGSENCRKLDALTHQAVEIIGVEAEFFTVTDDVEMMQYNIVSIPGLVINERLVSTGRIPSIAEITTWLVDAELRYS
jgi:hypothetical protein